MHSAFEGFFHAECSGGKSICSYDKTSTGTPDAYLRLTEEYRACEQWFVDFTSLWVYLRSTQTATTQ